jgi:dihydrolipoamide dehydrogenase
MQAQSVDLVIIGAGTAGISAFKEASKLTDKIRLIDHGPLGTTCARVGCMPSKALIQIADYFHDRQYFKESGIHGAEALQVNIPRVMQQVRKLRDAFTAGTINYIESLGSRFLKGNVEFIDKNTVSVNNQKIHAKCIIIAVGSASFIPEAWNDFKDSLLVAENIFEQDDFQKNIAVIGGGPIGIELGQALSRLGIKVELFHSQGTIGGLTDPVVNARAIQIFSDEFALHLNQNGSVEKTGNTFLVKNAQYTFAADQVVAAIGRKSNFAFLNLQQIGIKLNERGLPSYDDSTLQIEDLPIYIAGDAAGLRPLLHEAADEGRIAGYNAVRETPRRFSRRTPLAIIFSQPNIATVGRSFKSLQDSDFIMGEVHFEDQGRARIMRQNKGILRIYGARQTGKLLGAEMIAPEGEHLAHLLAQSIQQNMTAFDVLRMPFYHPVIEEGMRTALRHLASQVTEHQDDLELAMCDSEAVSNLS